MIAICPNGKEKLFITNDVNKVSEIIHCFCGEIHHKKEMNFLNADSGKEPSGQPSR